METLATEAAGRQTEFVGIRGRRTMPKRATNPTLVTLKK